MSVTYKSNRAQAIQAIHDTALDAIEQATYRFIYDSSQQLVPLDEGPLQESGEVIVEGDAVIVSYGKGESAAYAVIQHENLNYAHAPGRQAKYLEQPFRTAIPQIIGAVKTALDI